MNSMEVIEELPEKSSVVANEEAKKNRKKQNVHKVLYKRNIKFLSDKNGPRAYGK